MRAQPRLAIATLLVIAAGGCVRRDGRNTDCKWPGENPTHPVSARHISADAEFAEDLAIRYADVHFGLHSPTPSENYDAERDGCRERLFTEIGKQHRVPAEQVSDSLGRNRAYIDMAEVLPFALMYSFAAIATARMIWRRYAPDDSWAPGITMALFVSVGFALGATMLGEIWNGSSESYRIGNGHMSYRADRLFWAQHRLALFTAALVIFWLAAIKAARRALVATLNQLHGSGLKV